MEYTWIDIGHQKTLLSVFFIFLSWNRIRKTLDFSLLTPDRGLARSWRRMMVSFVLLDLKYLNTFISLVALPAKSYYNGYSPSVYSYRLGMNQDRKGYSVTVIHGRKILENEARHNQVWWKLKFENSAITLPKAWQHPIAIMQVCSNRHS